jgi:hypothetical protein
MLSIEVDYNIVTHYAYSKDKLRTAFILAKNPNSGVYVTRFLVQKEYSKYFSWWLEPPREQICPHFPLAVALLLIQIMGERRTNYKQLFIDAIKGRHARKMTAYYTKRHGIWPKADP